MDIVKQSLKNLSKILSKKKQKKTDIMLLDTPKMQLSSMHDLDYVCNIRPKSEVDEVGFFLSGEYYFVRYGAPVPPPPPPHPKSTDSQLNGHWSLLHRPTNVPCTWKYRKCQEDKSLITFTHTPVYFTSWWPLFKFPSKWFPLPWRQPQNTCQFLPTVPLK